MFEEAEEEACLCDNSHIHGEITNKQNKNKTNSLYFTEILAIDSENKINVFF